MHREPLDRNINQEIFGHTIDEIIESMDNRIKKLIRSKGQMFYESKGFYGSLTTCKKLTLSSILETKLIWHYFGRDEACLTHKSNKFVASMDA